MGSARTTGSGGRALSATTKQSLLKRRVKLLLTFLAVAFLVSWIFAANGEGTNAPVAVFGSWGIALSLWAMKSSLGIVIFCSLYFLCLFLLTTVASGKARRRGPLIPIIVHGLGSMAAASKIGHGVDVSAFAIVCGFAVSIVITMLYLFLDWNAARAAYGLE